MRKVGGKKVVRCVSPCVLQHSCCCLINNSLWSTVSTAWRALSHSLLQVVAVHPCPTQTGFPSIWTVHGHMCDLCPAKTVRVCIRLADVHSCCVISGDYILESLVVLSFDYKWLCVHHLTTCWNTVSTGMWVLCLCLCMPMPSELVRLVRFRPHHFWSLLLGFFPLGLFLSFEK